MEKQGSAKTFPADGKGPSHRAEHNDVHPRPRPRRRGLLFCTNIGQSLKIHIIC